jgi:hypothetical protein
MKILSRLFILISFAISGCGLQSNDLMPLNKISVPPIDQRYPVKNNHDSINDAYLHPAKWDGRSIAVQGTIKSILLSPNGQPSIELSVDNDQQTIIWAMSAFRMSDLSFFQVGQELRAMGWLRDSETFGKAIHSNLPTKDTMILLPICLVKIPNFSAVYDDKYQEYCEAWRRGYMPENLR